MTRTARSLIILGGTVAICAALVAFAAAQGALWHWFLQVTGAANESGHWYAFWSGFGSDLSEVTLIGAIGGVWYKHNCHAHGCWRIGRHLVDGTPWCNRHHQAARPAKHPARPDPAAVKIDRLADNIHGLAEALRIHLVADAQVSAGPGSNPGQSEGLPAETATGAAAERVVPPAATRKLRTPKERL